MRVELHVPSRPELGIRQLWLRDPEMMSYNAGWDVRYAGYDPITGCIDWPESEWSEFEARLRIPASQQGYYFVRDADDDQPVGDAYYEVSGSAASIGITIVPTRRSQGLGALVLGLLIERIWRDTDVLEIVNEFEDDREPAVRVHRRAGFVPDQVTCDDWGRPTRTWRLIRPGERAVSG
ncbi:GNAT family N-acetyltransferase [Cellulomonas soli]